MWGGKQLIIALFSIVESVNFNDIWEPVHCLSEFIFPICGFVGQRVLKTGYKTAFHPYSHLGTWHKGH